VVTARAGFFIGLGAWQAASETRPRLQRTTQCSERHEVLDWWIALKVKLELAWEFVGLADWCSIGVRCKEGHITLSGSVKNEYRQCKAEEAARRVRGVLSVTNDLGVREALRCARRTSLLVGPWPIPAYSEITIEEPPEEDRATSEAVLQGLSEKDVTTGEGAVRVCAVGRTVYLLGTVHDKATTQAAERVALAVPQVEQVRNKLQATPGSPEAGVAGGNSANHRVGETQG
jgi:osmotically-inducible protein OsmY